MPAGEELCYDYAWAKRELKDKAMACKCGAANCCMNMFGNLAKAATAEVQLPQGQFVPVPAAP